ncbi:MAG TPA: hypothetical protein VIO16_12255, partial [Dehalococcoidia bacterium]
MAGSADSAMPPSASAVGAAASRRSGPVGRLEQTNVGRRLVARGDRDLEFTPWTVTPATYVFRRLLVAILAGC